MGMYAGVRGTHSTLKAFYCLMPYLAQLDLTDEGNMIHVYWIATLSRNKLSTVIKAKRQPKTTMTWIWYL